MRRRFFSIFVPTLFLIMALACTPQVKTTVESSGPTIEQAITYHGPGLQLRISSARQQNAMVR